MYLILLSFLVGVSLVTFLVLKDISRGDYSILKQKYFPDDHKQIKKEKHKKGHHKRQRSPSHMKIPDIVKLNTS